jgi:hypothetical protein
MPGEIVTTTVLYQSVEADGCEGCAFWGGECLIPEKLNMPCVDTERDDFTNVIWVIVKQ